ncbi:MAG: SEC-C metal-binding domain-containing protein [Planctomycetota bacterium]
MPPSKEITLRVASFMDSAEREALGLADDEVRTVVSRFLTVCFEGVGAAPEKLDGHDLESALGRLLPAQFKRAEPLAASVPDVLRAYLAHLEESAVVTHAFELKQALESTVDAFVETVRAGSNPEGHGHAPRQETVEHRAAKLGRNDACFCGSGKKFKKCCGKK